MIRESGSYLVIVVLLSTSPRLQAAKKDIVNFDDSQFTVDNKTLAVAELSRKCLFDEGMLLAVGQNLNDELIDYLYRSEKASITSFASSKLFVQDWYLAASSNRQLYYDRRYYRFLWKSQGFLIVASSLANLKDQLDYLKSSRWWNSAGFFFFVEDDSHSIASSCADAYDFLSLADRYGLINVVFICQEQDGTVSIYSYNPYASSAPHPWLKNRETKGRRGHPWSLFKWEKYDGRRYTCESIFSDKTTSLNGYPVLTNAFSLSPFLYFDENETGARRYRGEDGWIMRTVWDFLNASVVDVPQAAQNAIMGWMDDNGTFHGNLIDINSGKVDISINSAIVLQPLWKVDATYPHSTVNFCFATKNRGTIPWLIGLGMVFDKWTTLCAIAIFFVSVVIFGYVDKRRYVSGYLNILRIFVSSSFIRPPSSNGLRIILCCILLMPVIFNSTLQANLLSVIRNPFNYANVETMEEVNANGFHVEGPELIRESISSKEARDSYVSTNDLGSCISKLHKGEPVACADYCSSVEVEASQHKDLHVAQDVSPQYPNRYIAKPDWPLLDRLNILLQRVVEAGLTSIYRVGSFDEKSAPPDDNLDDNTAVVLRLRDFRYVFMFLGIGWLCVTLVFVGELILGCSKMPEISKNRVKPVASYSRGYKISRVVNRMKLRFAGSFKN